MRTRMRQKKIFRLSGGARTSWQRSERTKKTSTRLCSRGGCLCATYRLLRRKMKWPPSLPRLGPWSRYVSTRAAGTRMIFRIGTAEAFATVEANLGTKIVDVSDPRCSARGCRLTPGTHSDRCQDQGVQGPGICQVPRCGACPSRVSRTGRCHLPGPSTPRAAGSGPAAEASSAESQAEAPRGEACAGGQRL